MFKKTNIVQVISNPKLSRFLLSRFFAKPKTKPKLKDFCLPRKTSNALAAMAAVARIPASPQ